VTQKNHNLLLKKKELKKEKDIERERERERQQRERSVRAVFGVCIKLISDGEESDKFVCKVYLPAEARKSKFH
jgi:hypothetical protein